VPIQLFLRSHCKNETLNLIGFGEVNAIKVSFSSGAGMKSGGMNSKPGTLRNHTFIYQ